MKLYDIHVFNKLIASQTIQSKVADFGLRQSGLMLTGNLVEYVVMQDLEEWIAK